MGLHLCSGFWPAAQGTPESGLKLCGFPKEMQQDRGLTPGTSCIVG